MISVQVGGRKSATKSTVVSFRELFVFFFCTSAFVRRIDLSWLSRRVSFDILFVSAASACHELVKHARLAILGHLVPLPWLVNSAASRTIRHHATFDA